MQTTCQHPTRHACARAALFAAAGLFVWMALPLPGQSVDLSGAYKIQFQSAPGSKNIPAGQGGGTPRTRAYKVDGQPPPLRDWARKVYEERLVEGENGHPFRHLMTRCLPQGMPMASLFAFYPVQLLQSKEQVTILYEEQNHFRVIRMNSRHPVDVDPSFFGDSIGRWENDTLVIDTVGIRDDTTIDFLGLPHSDQLHVIERMHQVDSTTLESRITLEDPKAFTKSWEAVAIWKRLPAGDGIKEYICENTRYFE